MVAQNGSTQLSRSNMSWMEEGACQNLDEDSQIFFPAQGYNAREAKKICARCPVRVQCLNWSIETRQMFGVWGGVGEKKRRMMMRLRYGYSPYYAVWEEEDEDIGSRTALGRP